MLEVAYSKLKEAVEAFPFTTSKQIGVTAIEDMYSHYTSFGSYTLMDYLLAVFLVVVGTVLIVTYMHYKKTQTVVRMYLFRYTRRNILSVYAFCAMVYMVNFTHGLLLAGGTLATMIGFIYLFFVGIYVEKRKWFNKVNDYTMAFVLITLVIVIGVTLEYKTTHFIKEYGVEREKIVKLMDEAGKQSAELVQIDIDKTLTDWSYMGSVALTNGEIINGRIEVGYSEKVEVAMIEYDKSYEYNELKLTREPIVLILPVGDKLLEYMAHRSTTQTKGE